MIAVRLLPILFGLGVLATSPDRAKGEDAAQAPGPTTVAQQRGESRNEFSITTTTDEGVWLGFRTLETPAGSRTGMRGFVQGQGTTVSRVVTDVSSGLFFGYRLTAGLGSDGRVRIEIGPLPTDFKPLASFAEVCPRCPPFTPLSATLVHYPAAQTVEDGGAFTFELLRNPKTGETLSDFVRVRVPKPDDGANASVKAPPPGPPTRFRVDLALRWDTADPETLLAEVHAFDLRTGKETTNEVLPLARPEETVQVRFGGMTPTNTPLLDVQLEVQASRSAGTVVYTIEVRERDELVHAEKVSLPYPKR